MSGANDDESRGGALARVKRFLDRVGPSGAMAAIIALLIASWWAGAGALQVLGVESDIMLTTLTPLGIASVVLARFCVRTRASQPWGAVVGVAGGVAGLYVGYMAILLAGATASFAGSVGEAMWRGALVVGQALGTIAIVAALWWMLRAVLRKDRRALLGLVVTVTCGVALIASEIYLDSWYARALAGTTPDSMMGPNGFESFMGFSVIAAVFFALGAVGAMALYEAWDARRRQRAEAVLLIDT